MQKHHKLPDHQAEPPEGRRHAAGQEREGRRFAVSQHKGRARGKLRYIETNDPSRGCRFL